MTRGLGHPERGSSAAQYVGIVALAAVIAGGVVAAGSTGFAQDAFSSAACSVLGGEHCERANPASAQKKSQQKQKTPLEQATWGSAYFAGDSFASGEGAGDYDPDTDIQDSWWNPLDNGNPTNKCHRSRNSYQAQAFRNLQGRGHFQGQSFVTHACSGAKTQDLHENNHAGNHGEGPQGRTKPTGPGDPSRYDNIPEDASLISLSMGGNDIGFAEVLKNCFSGWMGSGCGDTDLINKRIGEFYGTGNGTMGKLEQEIATIKAQHPDARIVIMGYPPLFSESKAEAIGISVKEQRWANQQAASINAAISKMAERQGVEFLDPTSAFVGKGYDHRIGSKEPWINGVGLSQEACHPNKKGHDAMTGLLLQHIEEGPK